MFKCVAVYLYSHHCELVFVKADEAYHIGAAASSQSYLNKQKIIDVAKASGAQVSYIFDDTEVNIEVYWVSWRSMLNELVN